MNNPQRIAEEFRLLIDPSADPRFVLLPGVNAFNAAPVVLPRAVFRATFKPFMGSGNVGTAEVSITVESHCGGDDADLVAAASSAGIATAAHEARCQLVREKFLGLTEADAPAVRAAIVAAINLAGRMEIQPRYLPVADTGMERDGDRFRTTLKIKAGVMVKTVTL